jgi:hypothetical protein
MFPWNKRDFVFILGDTGYRPLSFVPPVVICPVRSLEHHPLIVAPFITSSTVLY